MRQKSETRGGTPEQIVKDIRRATRKHHSAEEKIRIVLEGLRGEYSIAELCRREGIAESLYYSWSKEFLEAGKKRLAGDTARAATSGEVKDLRREVGDMKVLVADLTLERMEELQRLEPRGHGNPAVQLVVPGVRLSRAPQRIGREQQHVKLHITSGGTPVEVVWWNGGDKPWPDGRFDLACAPQINAYDGRRTVQLRLLDWRPATAV